MIKLHNASLKVLFVALLLTSLLPTTRPSYAQLSCPDCGTCSKLISDCADAAVKTSYDHQTKPYTIPFITEEFVMQREWLIKTLF